MPSIKHRGASAAPNPQGQPAPPGNTFRRCAELAGQAGPATSCPYCDRVGLPILPLRYAAVPTFVQASDVALPRRAPGVRLDGPNLPETPAGADDAGLLAHRPVVRTLRDGYVMVYQGGTSWQAYKVNSEGYLRKLPHPKRLAPVRAEGNLPNECVLKGHHISASFIHIVPVTANGRKALPKKIWMAFSSVQWTADTQSRFEGEAGEGHRRELMQEFDVEALAGNADRVEHAFQLTGTQAASRLHQIVYEFDETRARQMYREEAWGVDKTGRLLEWKGVHGVKVRTCEADAMQVRAKEYAAQHREQRFASAVVLHDPQGVVEELNGTRLQLRLWMERYLSHHRVVRPHLVSQAILGIKEWVADLTLADLKQQDTERWIEGARRQGKSPEEIEREKSRQNFGDTLQEQIYVDPGVFMPTGRYTTRRQRAAAKATTLWEDLQTHYREDARAEFQKHFDARVASYQSWLDRAERDYARALDDPAWQRLQRTVDGSVLAQQNRRIEELNDAIKGGPTHPAVQAIWDKFLALRGDDPLNPVYRALFGDRQTLLEHLNPDAPVPLDGDDDKVNKGHKLYKIVRAYISLPLSNESYQAWREGTYDVNAKPRGQVDNPVRAPLGQLKNRLLGNPQNAAWWNESMRRMVNRTGPGMLALSTALQGAFARNVGPGARYTGLIAVQAAVLLYQNQEVVLVTARMSFDEYTRVLQEFGFPGKAAARPVAASGSKLARSFAQTGFHTARPEVRDHKITVTFWSIADEQTVTFTKPPLAHAPQSLPSAPAGEVIDLRVHPWNLSPHSPAYLQALQRRYSHPLRALEKFAQDAGRFATSGTAMLGIASLFFQSWSLWDLIKKNNTGFAGNTELRILLVGSGLATLSALAEVGGQWVSLIHNPKSFGTALTRYAWTVAGIAGLGDGLQSLVAGERTAAVGDRDATKLYRLAAVSFVVSSFLSAGGSYLGATIAGLGPFALGLLLLAAGLRLRYEAEQAEDSRLAIWLDRCYFGKHDRYGYSRNPSERPWATMDSLYELSAAEIDQLYADLNSEVQELNALVLGLDATLEFQDSLSYVGKLIAATPMRAPGGGMVPPTEHALSEVEWEDKIRMTISFPSFDPARSAYEWRLYLRDKNGGMVPVSHDSHGATSSFPPPRAFERSAHEPVAFRRLVGPTKTSNIDGGQTTLTVEVLAEVSVHFDTLLLDVDYANDAVGEPGGLASLRLTVND